MSVQQLIRAILRGRRGPLLLLLALLMLSIGGEACRSRLPPSDDGIQENQAALRASDFNHWLGRANAGDVEGQLNVAYMYMAGRGVSSDREAAREWYESAAASGSLVAREALALIDSSGDDRVRLASRRDMIQEIQRSLDELGLLASPSDGVFGPNTEAAIKRAESQLGMAVTGQPSRGLRDLLAVEVGRRQSRVIVRALGAVDREGPVITAPKSIVVRGPKLVFPGFVADASRVADLRADGVPVAIAQDGAFQLERGFGQGQHELKLVATDEFGNETVLLIAVTRDDRSVLSHDFGRFYALVIGNNHYRNLPDLKTAVRDARAVAELLEQDYGYEVTLLIDASRTEIRQALAEQRVSLKEPDNLLIYYAGHGWNDESAEESYWLPVDADADLDTHWIANTTIATVLRAIKAKHVIVVADSCYSGTLTRGVGFVQNDSGFEQLIAKRSRTALTSGGNEPVVDGGRDGHSVFAREFLLALRQNQAVLDGASLFAEMRRPVMLQARQTPQYGDIRLAGHEGGDFLFVKRPTAR